MIYTNVTRRATRGLRGIVCGRGVTLCGRGVATFLRASSGMRISTMAARLAAVLILPTVLGCGTDPSFGSAAGAGSRVTARDSAGVRLVDLPPRGDPVQAKLLVDAGPAPDPDAPIGSLVDAAFGPNGEIVLLDGQAATVRVLAADGSPLRTLSGPGEGPAELSTFATSLVIAGDTVAVADWTRASWVRATIDGEALDPVPLPVPPPSRSWWRKASDGRLYGRSLRRTLDDEGGWGGDDLLLRARDGASGDDSAGVDTLGTFVYPMTDLGGQGAPRLPLVVNAPMWTILPDGTIAWSSLDRTEVRIGFDGSTRIRAQEWRRRPPRGAEVELLRERMGERLEALGGSAATLDALPVDEPELMPALSGMVSGDDHVVWVQRFDGVERIDPSALNSPEPPSRWGGPVWDRFELTSEGEVRALVPARLDPGVRILAIEGGRVLAAHTDEFGRVSPRVYRVPPGG
jgi:hypothetical protein